MSSLPICVRFQALALLAISCTGALADPIGGVSVVFEEDFQSARLTPEWLAKSRDICERMFKRPLEIRGDTTLIGKARVEEYYSADGNRRSVIRRRHLNLSKDPCVVDVLPITEKKLLDYEHGVVYRYNSNHKQPWTKGRVLTRSDAAEAAGALARSDLKPFQDGQRAIGKDIVAGVSCEVYQPKSDLTVCTWKAATSGDIRHPSLLNLSFRIQHPDGKVDTSTAVSVNLRAAINADLLLPPPEALLAK